MSWTPPLRDELRGVEPYGAPQLDVPVQLNTNENPYGPSALVIADIAATVAQACVDLNRYPDRDFDELRDALAAYLADESGVQLVRAQIWAANGSNEVMLHLLQAFGGPGRTAMSFAPTYSMYPEYARDTHTTWVQGHRHEDFSFDFEHAANLIAEHRPTVVLLPSPNNPTGTALPHDVIGRLAELVGDGVLVIDEAYAEFRRSGTPSALELLGQYPNLVVTRTMSKAFAAAGLRLGYLGADARICDALRVVRLPYHLSTTTQATALASLRHADELLAAVASLSAERDDLVEWLRAAGFEVADSDANFVMFGRFENRHAIWERLLDHGVLIREVGPEGWLRVSVGTPDEMDAFKRALKEVTA
jgi:histidinol-phosphate aminotransferase